jgi:hypothetical protein
LLIVEQTLDSGTCKVQATAALKIDLPPNERPSHGNTAGVETEAVRGQPLEFCEVDDKLPPTTAETKDTKPSALKLPLLCGSCGHSSSLRNTPFSILAPSASSARIDEVTGGTR